MDFFCLLGVGDLVGDEEDNRVPDDEEDCKDREELHEQVLDFDLDLLRDLDGVLMGDAGGDSWCPSLLGVSPLKWISVSSCVIFWVCRVAESESAAW